MKKKIVLSLGIIGLLVLAITHLWCSCSNKKYDSHVYDNSTTVEQQFHENKEDFEEMASVLYGSELFWYLYEIDRKSIFGPDIPKWEEYLTSEQYESVCLFLDKYKPYEIAGRGVLEFVFLCETEDASIYYTELRGEELDSYLDYIGQEADLKQLQEHWYLVVRESNVVREAKKSAIFTVDTKLASRNPERSFKVHQRGWRVAEALCK